MSSHRHRQLDEHVHSLVARGWRPKTEQGAEERRAVRQSGRTFVNDLDSIAFEHQDVDELSGLAAPMFDDEEPGRDHFKHEAERGNLPRGAPDAELSIVAPHTEMNARPLDRGRQ